jgi:hypothetical protein
VQLLGNDNGIDSVSKKCREHTIRQLLQHKKGGAHNFAIDRAAAEQVKAVMPDIPRIMQANRSFLRRAVTFLVEQGIDQFLDIGSGIPTVGSVHTIAQAKNPAVRVVYIDIDPLAVRQSEALLQHNDKAIALEGDARQPERILNHPEVRRLLDFNKPLAVLFVAVLHFVTDDMEAYRLVRVFCDALPAGSYLAISHGTYEGAPREVVAQSEQLYARTTTPVKARSRAEIERFFEGLELVAPGVVYVPLWHPESADDLFLDQPARSLTFGGVGRKT